MALAGESGVFVRLRRRLGRPDDTTESGERYSPGSGTACFAASTHLYLAPDGDVRACCRNWDALGNVALASLSEIWDGAKRRELEGRLEQHDFSLGCQQCEAEVAVEGRIGSYRQNFDRLGAEARTAAWPARIEFNISNACNLQCVQCNGFLSSAIRTHRDRLPPLPKVYGEAFFRDLRAFIPHLHEAQFAGGEPFLAPENFRVWSLIEELTPGLPCTVVTNATQWNRRIERLLSKHQMGFAFSIDGATTATYEAIRIGAQFDEVMCNVDRYLESARRSGMAASINHCLMAQNAHEFPQLLRMAESRSMPVNVSVVRSPIDSSIASLDSGELGALVRHLVAHDTEMRKLRLNGATWVREIARIRRWAEGPEEMREMVWWDEVADTRSPQREAIRRRKATVLDFPCAGTGATDTQPARERLALLGSVMSVTVEGGDPIIVACDDLFLTEFGLQGKGLVGRHAMELLPLFSKAYGKLNDYREMSRDDNQAEIRIQLEGADIECVMVPLRNASGWADQVRLFVVVRQQ